MPQYFKGDETEKKFDEAGRALLDPISAQLDALFAGAFEAQPLGVVLYDSKRAPLTRAIAKSIFRQAFKEIFEAFVAVGTFEAYITVFEKIFGETVEIEFTVPSPGKLNITIVAEGVILSDLVARAIVDGEYVFDEIVDDEDDNIALQTIQGFQSQYELEQMLFEMVPGGIFTQISLTLGA